MKKIVLQTVCLLVIGLMASCSSGGSGVDKNIALGDGFVERGEYENAVDAYQVAVDVFSQQTEAAPDDAKAWCNLGLAYRKQDDLSGLIGHFIREVLSDEKIKLLQDADTKAKAAYKKAIELKPDYAEAYCGLGRSTYSNSLAGLSEALPPLKKAVELKPDYAEAWYAIAHACYWDSGAKATAEEAFEKATGLNYADAWLLRGQLYMMKGKATFPSAIEAFEKTIKLNPRCTAAYAGLGMIYENLKEDEKAEEVYSKALEINPNYTYINSSVRKLQKTGE
ncbi:MAG: tetratricopeptide repeat protein [Tannerella sp.]|jgi:tetratricopeptide (TPR) repeat protein|nr:tetratricopeptide repeat protein [Tannerella sp.]